MKIAIIGPGAVGLLLAGYLSRTGAGARVELVDHSPQRAELLQKGIRWQGAVDDFTFRVPVTVGLREPEQKDLVVICVKAHGTAAVARELREAGYRGPVMTLQNGVDNAAAIARELPGSPLIAGVTSEGANLAAANCVRHAGKGKTSFGALVAGSPGAAWLGELAGIFRDAGLQAEIADDPMALVWGKALVNAGINPLTAILGVRNGQLLEIEPARKLMALLVREAEEVVRRKGIQPPGGDAVERTEQVCRLTAENYSSMYMDLKNGRRTEIDAINGAVVREGELLGVPCPRNQAITALVHALQERPRQ